MKTDIRKIVATALAELGDIEFLNVFSDRLARSEGSMTADPLKVPLFVVLAKR